jgi:hypothetical protein
MKKATLSILLSLIVIVSLVSVFAFCKNMDPTSPGPAPSAGDGVPEGSGFDRNEWHNDDSPGEGPAPNSGDGVPDGSGF